jgi:amino acid transporter
MFAIAVGLLLFLAWAFISMHAVPAARLAESTLPHMLAAREIAGQPGRMLMGGAVIAGVAGAVNGLFLMAGRALADLAGHGLLPEVAGKPAMTRTYPAFFAVIVGICLITGLAGHKVLEGLIEAALLLWLVHVGGLCIAVGRIPRRPEQAATIPPPLASGLGLVMLSFCLILTFTHEQALVIVCFSCAILAFTLLLSAIWPDTSRNSNTTPEKKQNHERRLS